MANADSRDRAKEPTLVDSREQSPENGTERIATEFWELRLYVAGQTPRSIAALQNLKGMCEQYLAGKHRIEVIDLSTRPELARRDQIVAIPTLVRKLPEPIRKIIGDLSNTDRALAGLDVHKQAS